MSDVIERAKEQLEENRHRYTKVCPNCLSEEYIIGKKCENCGYNAIYMTIKRLPLPTFYEFKQFAFDEFAMDYGAAFAHIWKQWKEWKEEREILITTVMNLDNEMKELQKPINEKAKKGIKMINGRIVAREKNEQNVDGQGV